MPSIKIYSKEQTDALLNDKATVASVNAKQDTLVSGTNIKTINNTSILGTGNIATAETWTFTLDDDSTITKQVLIIGS